MSTAALASPILLFSLPKKNKRSPTRSLSKSTSGKKKKKLRFDEEEAGSSSPSLQVWRRRSLRLLHKSSLSTPPRFVSTPFDKSQAPTIPLIPRSPPSPAVEIINLSSGSDDSTSRRMCPAHSSFWLAEKCSCIRAIPPSPDLYSSYTSEQIISMLSSAGKLEDGSRDADYCLEGSTVAETRRLLNESLVDVTSTLTYSFDSILWAGAAYDLQTRKGAPLTNEELISLKTITPQLGYQIRLLGQGETCLTVLNRMRQLEALGLLNDADQDDLKPGPCVADVSSSSSEVDVVNQIQDKLLEEQLLSSSSGSDVNTSASLGSMPTSMFSVSLDSTS